MFVVYIIKSQKTNCFYTGHCENFQDRLKKHNNKRCKYTKSKVPWVLVYLEKFETRSEAMKREGEIKRKKSRKYIEWLIDKQF